MDRGENKVLCQNNDLIVKGLVFILNIYIADVRLVSLCFM